MKLSEAIIIGMTKTKQTFGTYFYNTDKGLEACALGAACVGAEMSWGEDPREYINKNFPVAGIRVSQCPAPGCKSEIGFFNHVGFMVVHLNDHHQWDRGRIALWVKEIEARVEGPAPTISPCKEKQLTAVA